MAIKYLSINNEILDISNILTKETIYVTQSKHSSHAGNIVFSNKFAIQWGEITVNNPVVTIPLKMADNTYQVFWTNPQGKQGDGTAKDFSLAFYRISNSQFRLLTDNNVDTDGLTWMVIGFID